MQIDVRRRLTCVIARAEIARRRSDGEFLYRQPVEAVPCFIEPVMRLLTRKEGTQILADWDLLFLPTQDLVVGDKLLRGATASGETLLTQAIILRIEDSEHPRDGLKLRVAQAANWPPGYDEISGNLLRWVQNDPIWAQDSPFWVQAP
jgi:hypothetical protein